MTSFECFKLLQFRLEWSIRQYLQI